MTKNDPVKRTQAPVLLDTVLQNARPGWLSLTIVVCYLVQLKHPLSLSLSSLFFRGLFASLSRCCFFPFLLFLFSFFFFFFCSSNATGTRTWVRTRARNVHWHCAGACINFACPFVPAASFSPSSLLSLSLSLRVFCLPSIEAPFSASFVVLHC